MDDGSVVQPTSGSRLLEKAKKAQQASEGVEQRARRQFKTFGAPAFSPSEEEGPMIPPRLSLPHGGKKSSDGSSVFIRPVLGLPAIQEHEVSIGGETSDLPRTGVKETQALPVLQTEDFQPTLGLRPGTEPCIPVASVNDREEPPILPTFIAPETPPIGLEGVDTAFLPVTEGPIPVCHPMIPEEIVDQPTQALPPVPAQPIETSDYSDHGEVAVKSAGSAAVIGLGELSLALLRYVTTLSMTHMVSLLTYGAFVETFALVSLLGGIACCGFDALLLRFLPIYRVRQDADRSQGLVLFTLCGSIAAGLLLAILCFLGANSLSHGSPRYSVYGLPLQEMAPVIPLLALQMLFAALLQAQRLFTRKIWVDRLVQPVVTLILLVGLYLNGLRLEALVFSLIGGYLVSTILGAVFLIRTKLASGPAPTLELRPWLLFALPMLLTTLIRSSLNSLDVLQLGLLSSPSQVAIYGAADRLSWLVGLPLFAFNVIFAPLISEQYAKRSGRALTSLFQLLARWSLTLSTPIFVIEVMFRVPLLGLFSGEYVAGGEVLMVLALGLLIDSACGSVQYLLILSGRPLLVLLNTAIAAVVNLGLGLWLIPTQHGLGAAIAASASLAVLNGLSLLQAWLFLETQPFSLASWRPVIAGLVMGGVGLAAIRIIPLATSGSPLIMIGLASALLLIYGAFLLILGINQEDRWLWRAAQARLLKSSSAS